MKILQVISRFDFGGAENYVRELANDLSKKGNRVWISGTPGRQIKQLNDGVCFIGSCFLCKLILFRAIHYVWMIRKHQIDLIHAHQRLPIVAASLAGWLTNTPVVVSVHGRVRHDLSFFLSRRIPQLYIFVSQQVLVVSRFHGLLAPKSVVIPNGISDKPANCAIRPYSIGYISRLDSRHASVVSMLIEIMPMLHSEFPEVTLTIVGDGTSFAELRKKTASINHQLGKSIISMPGYIENFSTAAVAPELIVGVGRVAMEALQRGCTVIPINCKRTGSVVTEKNYEFYLNNNFMNINGLKPDREKLIELISDYFHHRTKYREKGAYLSEKINNECCWNAISSKIYEQYDQVVKQKIE